MNGKKRQLNLDGYELENGSIGKIMKLILVAGARPNFMKIAPLVRAISSHNENMENTN